MSKNTLTFKLFTNYNCKPLKLDTHSKEEMFKGGYAHFIMYILHF